VQAAGIRKELQALKKEFVPEFRPINVLLQTKAQDMTASEIDRLVQEVPLQELPTDILVAVLDRGIDEINEYLGTSFKSVADMPSEMLKKMPEHLNNDTAAD
jgi:hypothetical protein